MPKQNNSSKYQFNKISQELKKLEFKFRQLKTQMDGLSAFYTTQSCVTRTAYNQLHADLLGLLYQLYHLKPSRLTTKSKRQLQSVIQWYYETTEINLLQQLPLGEEIHQFLHNETLEEYYQDDLGYQKEEAIYHLENNGIPFDKAAIENAVTLLELENSYLKALEMHYATAFMEHAPELIPLYNPGKKSNLKKVVDPEIIERWLQKHERIHQRLIKVIDLNPVILLIIKPDFKWEIIGEDIEEQEFYLQEAKKYFDDLDAEQLILLGFDWLNYMQDFIRKLPEEDLITYIEYMREFRKEVSIVMENIRGQANLDELALDFPTESHSLNTLTILQKIDLLDIKNTKHISILLTDILQQDSLSASYPPLVEVLAWLNKRAKTNPDFEWEDE
jgi:hypothetical protein